MHRLTGLSDCITVTFAFRAAPPLQAAAVQTIRHGELDAKKNSQPITGTAREMGQASLSLIQSLGSRRPPGDGPRRPALGDRGLSDERD